VWFLSHADEPTEAQLQSPTQQQLSLPAAPHPTAVEPHTDASEDRQADPAKSKVSISESSSEPVHFALVKEEAILAPGERVKKVYPDGLLIEGAGGIGLKKVKFRTLPESIQRKYGYDPRKAAEYEAAQVRAAAEYRANELRKDAQARAHQIAEAQVTDPECAQRITILSQIVSDYYRNHTYSMEDRFVCSDMACDVWNMVKTKGIPAKIQVGNVESDVETIAKANHAWVLAEACPGKWIALETTAGRLVSADENPRYYRGWSFENPKQYKEAAKDKR
jgi:hypothetical protein